MYHPLSFAKRNTARKTIFFSKCSEKMIFPKNCAWTWYFLYYLERWYFSFPNIWSHFLDGKWKMIFLKKIHGNVIFSLNAPKRWSFQKKSCWNIIFLVLSGKMTFSSIKYDIFILDVIWNIIFLKKYIQISYFLYICLNVTNMILRKKVRDDLLPKKYT